MDIITIYGLVRLVRLVSEGARERWREDEIMMDGLPLSRGLVTYIRGLCIATPIYVGWSRMQTPSVDITQPMWLIKTVGGSVGGDTNPINPTR